MQLFERIRRCRYCKAEMMDVSCESYMENPFCAGCLHERMEKANTEAGPGHWEPLPGTDGQYVRWVKDKSAPVSPHSQGAES